jgi:hypothetical protein
MALFLTLPPEMRAEVRAFADPWARGTLKLTCTSLNKEDENFFWIHDKRIVALREELDRQQALTYSVSFSFSLCNLPF